MKTYFLSEQEIQDLKDLKVVLKKVFKEKFKDLSDSEKKGLLKGEEENVLNENQETKTEE
jgi:hypothetical protein